MFFRPQGVPGDPCSHFRKSSFYDGKTIGFEGLRGAGAPLLGYFFVVFAEVEKYVDF